MITWIRKLKDLKDKIDDSLENIDYIFNQFDYLNENNIENVLNDLYEFGDELDLFKSDVYDLIAEMEDECE